MDKLENEYFRTPAIVHFVTDDETLVILSPELASSIGIPIRLRIWEIEERFKCPVIGWCLEISEQKETLRKEKISIKDKSNFEIHEIVVESLGEENRLSQRIDFCLNRKYQREIKAFSSLEEESFMEHWKASLKKEELEAFVWVAVTKADLSSEAKRTIFGDVHMEMHDRARQIGHERQRLDQVQKSNETLAERVREVSRTNKILKREIEEVSNELTIVCRLYDTLQERNKQLESELSKVNEKDFITRLQRENVELRAGKDGILRQISVYERELRKLQHQNNKLLFKLKKQWQTRMHPSNASQSLINQDVNSTVQESVSALDLSQTSVLVVGGLPKMESHYRRLIEGNKGTFEYHDGRMNAGVKELVGQIRRADLVLCCIDRSSHTAALVVKKLCKKVQKPFQMLPISSLSNVSLTLQSVQDKLTSVQNGHDDFHNNLVHNRSRGLIVRQG